MKQTIPLKAQDTETTPQQHEAANLPAPSKHITDKHPPTTKDK